MRFHQNYEGDGFLVFDSSAGINFIGNLLVNYKGLRVIRFHKSQLMPGDFDEPSFHGTCDQILTDDSKR